MFRTTRTALLACATLLALASPAFAQLDANLGALTPENVKGYLNPLPKALSATLNMAEFQSASIPLVGLNFTVGVHAMGVTFKDDDKTYTPKDPQGFVGTAPAKAPTVIGSTQAYLQPGQGGTSLYHPGGFDLSQFLIAVPQVSIGSVLGTRAVVRWIEADIGDSELGKVKVLGIGVQHSISRYLPNPLPVDLAIGGMYQTFKLGKNDLIDTRATHFEVTASKKLGLFFQPYAAVGYDTFKMDVNYDQNQSGGGPQSVKVSFDNQNNAHFTAGLQVGLPMVKLNAQVDHAAETGVAVGLRFGLGN